MQDYGAPVGYRLAVKNPERMRALIVQNGNAYEEGLRGVLEAAQRLLGRSQTRRTPPGCVTL